MSTAPATTTTFRSRLAAWLVGGHGVAMFVLFATPLELYLLNLFERRPGAALAAGTLMVAAFVGTLRFAGPLLTVSGEPAPSNSAWGVALRRFRALVGNGDAMQALARRIDPGWVNPFSGRTPAVTLRWLWEMERIHWAALAGSVPVVAAAFYDGRTGFGFAYVAANLLYNVAPNLVLRDTRRRIQGILRRRPTVRPSAIEDRREFPAHSSA